VVCMLPLFHSGWNSAPWPPSSCARLPHPSLGSRYRGKLYGQLGRAGLFAAFAASRPVALTLRTHPLMQASRHCFRSLPSVSPDGVLGMHATPSPNRRGSAPWPPPSSARLPIAAPSSTSRARSFARVPATFPGAFPVSVARLSPRGSPCWHRPDDTFGCVTQPLAQVCKLPLPSSRGSAS
jgi:hypothetical protein